MPDETYTELDAVQLRQCELLISSHKRRGKTLLSIAPRKSFVDPSTGELKSFIPKRSSIEIETASELDDILHALIDIRNEGLLE